MYYGQMVNYVNGCIKLACKYLMFCDSTQNACKKMYDGRLKSHTRWKCNHWWQVDDLQVSVVSINIL